MKQYMCTVKTDQNLDPKKLSIFDLRVFRVPEEMGGPPLALMASLGANVLVYGLICSTVVRWCLRMRRGWRSQASIRYGFYCLGQVLNAGLCKLLKAVIAQERPRAGCRALGTCGEWGMPSNHSQVMLFWVAYWWREGQRVGQRGGQRVGPGAFRGSQWVTAVAGASVPVLRVVSGHHTAWQVVVGSVTGVVAGRAWRAVERAFEERAVFQFLEDFAGALVVDVSSN